MKPLSNRHHGMAYLMVMLTLGIAAVLGMATLTSTALSAQASGTQQLASQANCAADSALQVALYGLQNPSSVPAAWTNTSGHALLASNVSISTDAGRFDIDAIGAGTRDTYKISLVGRSAFDQSISRSTLVQSKLIRAKCLSAGVFSDPMTVSTHCTFTGSVLSGGVVSLSGTGTISGSVRTTVLPTDFAIPSAATINYYGAGASAGIYLMPDGITAGTPEQLSATPTSLPTASATNPGHVFFRNGDLNLSGVTSQKLSGTLIVKGNLTVAGIGGSLTITPVAQMPAIITSGYIKPNSRNLTLTANGAVWAGGGFTWGTALTSTQVKINGCLLLPSGASLGTPNSASIVTVYNAATADVPDISITPQPVTGVRVLSYTAQ